MSLDISKCALGDKIKPGGELLTYILPTEARIFLKCKLHHVTPMLKTFQCLPTDP